MTKPFLPKGSRTYHIHPRVPQEYRDAVGSSHVTRSLRTRDFKDAKKRVHSVMQRLQAEWDAKRAAKSASLAVPQAIPGRIAAREGCWFDDAEHACAYFYEKIRAREQAWRGYMAAYVADSEGIVPPMPADFRARLAAGHKKGVVERLALLEQSFATGDFAPFLVTAHRYFFERDLEDDFVIALALTERQFLESLAANDAALYTFVDEIDGQWVLQDLGGRIPRADRPLQQQRSVVPLLSKFTEDYITRRGNGLSDERASTIRATVRDLLDIVGDKSVTAYSATDASGFEAVMLTLPPNWMKNRTLRKLTITKAAEKARALGLQRQAAKNIRKKWAALSTVFENAALLHPVKNPFVAKALIVDDGVAANEQWDTFKPAEISALFASELPGPLHWLTWLGRYTGARLNELCQLTTDLVRQHGGLHYLYFSPALRLKTREKKSSVRAVPLHPDLIEAGFLKYVSKCDGPLFPGLTQHKSGRYSDAQSKAFTRHLKELGLKRPKLSFHSLRHSFGEAFKRHAPRDVETRERLIGHVVAGVAGRYGGSYESEAADMVLLAQRAEVLASVKL